MEEHFCRPIVYLVDYIIVAMTIPIILSVKTSLTMKTNQLQPIQEREIYSLWVCMGVTIGYCLEADDFLLDHLIIFPTYPPINLLIVSPI